jgi:hypothetical protein
VAAPPTPAPAALSVAAPPTPAPAALSVAAPPTPEPAAPVADDRDARIAAAFAELEGSTCGKKARQTAAAVLKEAITELSGPHPQTAGDSVYRPEEIEGWRAESAEAVKLRQQVAELSTEIANLRAAGALMDGETITAGIHLFTDGVPIKTAANDARPLDPYVDSLERALREKYVPAGDIRCAPDESPLAFGKWRGVLAAFARQSPPAAGTYYVDTRGREIVEVVVDALRPQCVTFVRGGR